MMRGSFKVTIHYVEEEADPSVFEKALVEPVGAFLVVTDTTKAPEVVHLIPAERIDVATAEPIQPEYRALSVGS